MKSFISYLLAAALTAAATAETHDLHYGTIEAPEDFVFKRTGTVDSFMGTLTRKSDGFAITFDVGVVSGKLMHESRKAGRRNARTFASTGSAAFPPRQESRT